MKPRLSVYGRTAAVLAVMAMLDMTAAVAAPRAPDGENGRYSMAPIPDGVLRLDTRTGTVSTCKDSGTGWACYAVPDERTAWDAEIGHLKDEVERLKAQLAAREQAQGGPPVASAPQATPPQATEPKVSEGRKFEIPLPSDADVDRVMSFLERTWRRLIDMAGRVQKDVSGKI